MVPFFRLLEAYSISPVFSYFSFVSILILLKAQKPLKSLKHRSTTTKILKSIKSFPSLIILKISQEESFALMELDSGLDFHRAQRRAAPQLWGSHQKCWSVTAVPNLVPFRCFGLQPPSIPTSMADAHVGWCAVLVPWKSLWGKAAKQITWRAPDEQLAEMNFWASTSTSARLHPFVEN